MLSAKIGARGRVKLPHSVRAHGRGTCAAATASLIRRHRLFARTLGILGFVLTRAWQGFHRNCPSPPAAAAARSRDRCGAAPAEARSLRVSDPLWPPARLSLAGGQAQRSFAPPDRAAPAKGGGRRGRTEGTEGTVGGDGARTMQRGPRGQRPGGREIRRRSLKQGPAK